MGSVSIKAYSVESDSTEYLADVAKLEQYYSQEDWQALLQAHAAVLDYFTIDAETDYHAPLAEAPQVVTDWYTALQGAVILLDPDAPALNPLHDLASALVYAADTSCVDTVICDGRVLMSDKVLRV